MNYFKFVTQLLIKSQFSGVLLANRADSKYSRQKRRGWQLDLNSVKLTSKKLQKLLHIYDKTIFGSQIKANLILNCELITLIKEPSNYFTKLSQLLVFKKHFSHIRLEAKDFSTLFKSSNYRPILYLSMTLKDQLNYFKFECLKTNPEHAESLVPEPELRKQHSYLKKRLSF